MSEILDRKKLVLLDGHAIFHRAFHAMNTRMSKPLTTSTGEPSGAVFGFATMLMKAINEERPEYMAVTFDLPTPTFRHKHAVSYKAHRPPLPDQMRSQFPYIRDLVQAFGLPIYELDGFEADDMLGTLSRQAFDFGLRTVIYTGDGDTLQLVNDHVVVKMARGTAEVIEYHVADVINKYGFEPDKLIDFKGLKGDTSDNIPGVPGIGDKTAIKLISEYGTIENLFANLANLPAKDRKKLEGQQEKAEDSKYLATIICDAPVQLDLDKARLNHIDTPKVLSLFRHMEFRSLVNNFLGLMKRLGLPLEGDEALIKEEFARIPAISIVEDATEKREILPGELIGVVTILELPEPPGDGLLALTEVIDARNAEKTALGVTVAQTSIEENHVQLNLFEVASAPVQKKLVLPPRQGVEEPLYLEEEANQKTHTTVIDTEEELAGLIERLHASGSFAIDTETTSEDPRKAELVGISLAMIAGEAYYIPVGHGPTVDGQEAEPQLALSLVFGRLRPILEDVRIGKYMHNAKYDLAIFARYQLVVQGLRFDTMVGAYLADPGRRGIGLKEQAFQRLGIVMTNIQELIGSGSKAISMAQVPIRKAADYAGADADITLRLVAPIQADLERHGLTDLYDKVELPLISVLLQMERYGVALDTDFLRDLGGQLEEQIGQLEANIYASVGGRSFNINSNKQLGEILFEELKLPFGRKTKTGYSVGVDVIEGLQGQHEIIEHLLAYRQLTKLKSTYVDGLLTLVDKTNGRVYTSFNQTIASSGRLSSSNPNLQNIPVRTEQGRQIRRAFIADPSYVLLSADYSQIELRILAHVTHEPRLIEAFTKDEDIHTITAASLFNVVPEEVTKDQRRLAKTVVFAVLYGQSAFGLANLTGMNNSEASDFIKRYHETFPSIKNYVDKTLEQARHQGFVNTIYGRKRFFPEMKSLSHGERQAFEREAVNMPIQGSNADLIKLAMIRLAHTLQVRRSKIRMILQVHDELIFEVPVEEIEQAKRLIKAEMEGVPGLETPLKVEMKIGPNWYATEQIKDLDA